MIQKNNFIFLIICVQSLACNMRSIAMRYETTREVGWDCEEYYVRAEALLRAEIHIRAQNPSLSNRWPLPPEFIAPIARGYHNSIQSVIIHNEGEYREDINGIDAEYDDGKTKLMHAAANGEFALVRTLLTLRADPRAQNERGETVRDYLCTNLVAQLRTSGGNNTRGRGPHCVVQLHRYISHALDGYESYLDAHGEVIIDTRHLPPALR